MVFNSRVVPVFICLCSRRLKYLARVYLNIFEGFDKSSLTENLVGLIYYWSVAMGVRSSSNEIRAVVLSLCVVQLSGLTLFQTLLHP